MLLTISLLKKMKRVTDIFTPVLTNVEKLVGDGNLVEFKTDKLDICYKKGSRLSKKLRGKMFEDQNGNTLS